jgi:hypothetical protein
VQARGKPNALEGLFLDEPFANQLQERASADWPIRSCASQCKNSLKCWHYPRNDMIIF